MGRSTVRTGVRAPLSMGEIAVSTIRLISPFHVQSNTSFDEAVDASGQSGHVYGLAATDSPAFDVTETRTKHGSILWQQAGPPVAPPTSPPSTQATSVPASTPYENSNSETNERTLQFTSIDDGWFVNGNGHSIVKTTDGGVNWKTSYSMANINVTAIDFANEEDGWAVVFVSGSNSGIPDQNDRWRKHLAEHWIAYSRRHCILGIRLSFGWLGYH